VNKSLDESLDLTIVTGCARSGTSLVAGLIAKHGFFGGRVTGAGAANKKGFFENKALKDRGNKRLLELLGADPLGQHPLPERAKIDRSIAEVAPQLRRLSAEVFRAEGHANGPVFFKDAKCALLWPYWHAAFPKAHWIIVRRPDEEIVRSCERTPFMHKAPDWQAWVDAHKPLFTEILQTCDACEVWSSDIIAGKETPLTAFLERKVGAVKPEVFAEHVSKDLFSA